MQTRLSPSQTEYPNLNTEQLRAAFLVDSLLTPGRVELVYTDADRAIIGSAVPTGAPLLGTGLPFRFFAVITPATAGAVLSGTYKLPGGTGKVLNDFETYQRVLLSS